MPLHFCIVKERYFSMRHVMLDLYGCSPDLLENEDFLRQVLDQFPTRIGMQKVGPVELRYIETNNPSDDGYSGFAIIATSHVSLHAWAPYGMINLDIFSCEDFSVADVVAFARRAFQTNDIEVHVVERATRSPRISTRQLMQQECRGLQPCTGPLSVSTPTLT
jgi:S-adenosylmethionine decarboxylase